MSLRATSYSSQLTHKPQAISSTVPSMVDIFVVTCVGVIFYAMLGAQPFKDNLCNL